MVGFFEWRRVFSLVAHSVRSLAAVANDRSVGTGDALS